MSSLDHPKLRIVHASRVDRQGGNFVALTDPYGLFEPLLVTLGGYLGLLRYCDGAADVGELCRQSPQRGGPAIREGEFRAFLADLDRRLVLDGPSFARYLDVYRRESIRPAAFAGRSYPANSQALRRQLEGYFRDPRGAGLPVANRDHREVRAILAPHIDFARGGPIYTWPYRQLIERSDTDLFVILGVAHQGSSRRFVLTRKHFETPFGRALTDQDFVDRLAERLGPGLFDDELAHRTEHSIEFPVVFLQHLLNDRPVTIVPILVGSFHDLMADGADPIDDGEVARFVAALRDTERESGRRVAYIGSIDLTHVGPEFGDPEVVSPATREIVREFDARMLDRAVAADASGWFATAAEVGDRWRICGLAATYTLLHAVGPVCGELLAYDQAVDPAGRCCVTFAGVSYESV